VALLEHKLSKLNPDEIEELYKTNELKFPQITYDDEDVSVVFNPYMPEAQFDDNTRAIVMFPIETFWGAWRRNNKRFLSFKSETIWRIRKTIFNMYQPLSKRTSFRRC
jgi:hypothetical protein